MALFAVVARGVRTSNTLQKTSIESGQTHQREREDTLAFSARRILGLKFRLMVTELRTNQHLGRRSQKLSRHPGGVWCLAKLCDHCHGWYRSRVCVPPRPRTRPRPAGHGERSMTHCLLCCCAVKELPQPWRAMACNAPRRPWYCWHPWQH